MKFPRGRAANGQDLWAKDPKNKADLDKATSAARGSQSTTSNVGIRSTLKKQLFEALPLKDQEFWNAQAAVLKSAKTEEKKDETVWEYVVPSTSILLSNADHSIIH